MGDEQVSSLANPVINGPYDPPTQHFELGPNGPTGVVLEGRRPSESFIPIAPVRKGKRGRDDSVQEVLALTHEQVRRNSLINDLRGELDVWRARNYDGVTPITRKLLLHWADTQRDNRVLFAQREAAETAIYLAEVAGRERYGSRRDWRTALAEINTEHNDGLPRTALKMATGSGKTVVMAMLIAWHTLNKVASQRDPRFVRRFLVVAPGITIRDRLRVLQPADLENYYDARELVPGELRGQLGRAQVLVVNYHQFLLRDSKEIKGVAAATRRLLLNGRDDPFRETPEAMVSRVLRGWGVGSAAKQSEILVFNDEAHHCYQDKPVQVEGEDADAEDKARNVDARVWFKGLQAVRRKVGVKAVYDLSATPFYLKGSGHQEGFIFPWVVSDFALMDAIESGIVKVPRTPVDDDAAHETVTYLDLWDKVGKVLPGARSRKSIAAADWVPPDELVGALRSLYASYERTFRHWQDELAVAGHPPPVFIVVCPNTSVSKLVFDWVAGHEVPVAGDEAGTRWAPASLPLFANVEDGLPLDRPRTVLVDSAQLESGESMKKEFKDAAAAEMAAFQAEMRLRNPGADVDSVSDEDLLREVMNTVGKRGRLGEQVRCVVSVAMLTEGWDANTVTHILGLRAFRSQLLCEQVVGRGLRRRSYDVGDDGCFEPEYANVFGVPFAFIPTDKPVGTERPPRPSTLVRSIEGRESARITFPRLVGYRLEAPERGQLYLPDDLPRFVIGPDVIPGWTVAEGIVGQAERIVDAPNARRPQTVAFHLASRLVRTHYRTDPQDGGEGDERPWLFPELVRLCCAWIERAVEVRDGFSLAHLTAYVQWQSRAADEIYRVINRQGEAQPLLRPILDAFAPEGSTEQISFVTRKVALHTDQGRCEVSHVVLDGATGNTWEQLLMEFAEHHRDVAAYVKNDRLRFEIPYVHEGRPHAYVPDFLLRLRQRAGDPAGSIVRTLVVEVSGGHKRALFPAQVEMKAAVARDQWCVAVNNHGGFGRWGYLEITDMTTAKADLDAAIQGLYADGPVAGITDRADWPTRDGVHRAAS